MSMTHLELFDQLGDYPTPFDRCGEEDEDYDEDEDDEDGIPKIRIGICAMSKKTNSPPMQEILNRMSVFDCADIFVFSEDIIMNVPVDKWPICDCLISFYSNGFPLEKAIEYAKLTNPFVLNDLEMQYALMDRPTVYSILEIAGIETPRHAILLRDENGNPINTKFVELDDSVQIGNKVFQKPFVEKPVDAEDHNVYIYFPSAAGGGSQRLFRKVGDRSSVYSPVSSVRKEGSYIYEDFIVTDGTDVKVYTVGPEYAHAEARKSPSLDGKVERDSQGKEIRYPIILDQHEKELAHKVCKLFKQTVCGCDLLRTHGKSYICDVNGFSFVKNSKKYYDDAAQVLMSLIVQELAPQLYKPYNLDVQEEIPTSKALGGTMLELRCVIGVIRHGDRTPKQKMKMEVRHPRFIDLFRKYHGFEDRKLKLKRPTQLQEVLNIARDLLADIKEGKPVFEKPNKIHQLRTVLEMYGHFSGINRKIQFKYLGKGKPRDGTDSEHSDRNVEIKGEDEGKRKESGEGTSETSKQSKQTEGAYQKGSEDKLEVPVDKEHSLLLIVKWGGELTMMGKEQALDLGRAFRCMYPGGQGQCCKLSDCGLLRLHSTYRHDLKIYASDEGRVQMTAAAFAKGFLALEGELAPVLAHLVRSDKNTTEMLDTPDDAAKILGKVKHRLHKMLHSNEDFKEADFAKLAPTRCQSVINAMRFVKNPYKMCEKIYNLMQALTGHLKEMIAQKLYDPRDPFLYQDETLELMMCRWTKLEKDFKLRSGKFDISLIPDIYDCIKYDVQHNSQLNLINSLDLYKCAKAFADIVIPLEYGITRDEKLGVAQSVCSRLLKNIKGDLRHADSSDIHTRLNPDYLQSVEAPHRHVRTRLYFTSESHVHTVLNALKHGKLLENIPDEQWQTALEFLAQVPELNYMTQLVLMLYEDPEADPLSDHRFHVELHFSPGAKTMDDPEFLASTSAPRKASEEEMRSYATKFRSTDRDVALACKTSKVDEVTMIDSGHQSEDTSDSVISEDPSLCDLTTSSHFLVTASTEPGPHEADNSQDCMKEAIGTSQVLESADEEAAESNVFEAYDEVVYSGNELPRFAIGSDDYSDSALGASVEDICFSSGMSMDEIPGEETLLSRRRHSMSDTEVKSFHGVTTDEPGQQVRKKGTQISRRKSETDFVNNVATTTRDVTQKEKGGGKISSVACIVEEDAAEPHVPVGRPKCHSTIEDVNIDKNSQETPKPPAARTRRVSFEHGQQVKTIESSSQYKKRFSAGSASAIRALRKLSFDIQSAWVVRPHSVTKNSKKSSKPRIAEFYEEMTKVESLHPLRTLHNAVPLKKMDKFFDKVTGQNTKVRFPTVPWREGNVTDLLTEAFKKLHSKQE